MSGVLIELPSPELQDVQYQQSLDQLERQTNQPNRVLPPSLRSFSLALKQLLQKGDMALDIMATSKTLDDGRAVLQVYTPSPPSPPINIKTNTSQPKLETAAGSIVKHFANAHCVQVSRERFLPVKDCSDLLLVRSDVFVLDHGRLVMNPNRAFGIPPVIKLGGHFKKASYYFS